MFVLVDEEALGPDLQMESVSLGVHAVFHPAAVLRKLLSSHVQKVTASDTPHNTPSPRNVVQKLRIKRDDIYVLLFTETRSPSLSFSPVIGSVPLSVMYLRISRRS